MDVREVESSESIEVPLTVAKTKRSSTKLWDKKHSCVFCHKTVTKMHTHLQRVHHGEPQVARVLAMTKGTTKRRHGWGELLNEGDFKHNYTVLEKGIGELIPKYRSKKRSVGDCVTCPYCKGLYGTSLLYLHTPKCPMRNTEEQRGKGNC